jgi:hypothetical protein
MIGVFPASRALAEEPVTAPTTRGWLGLEERNVWGLEGTDTGCGARGCGSATADYGLDAVGGVWLLHEHLMPIADLGWSRVANVPYTVDTFRGGGRLAIGTPASNERFWVGGTVGAVVQAGWLHGPTGSVAWAVSPSASALLQARVTGRVFVGGELGVEHSIPALEWATTSHWGLPDLRELLYAADDPISGDDPSGKISPQCSYSKAGRSHSG